MYAQFAAFLLGVWLTASPGTLGYGDPAWSNDHVLGPLAAMAGLIAVFQETRGVRWVNLPLGAWLAAAPWVLGYPGWPETVNSMLVGVGLAGLACVRGTITKQLGGGWAALWRPDRAAVGGSA
jgi:hypothetical protein